MTHWALYLVTLLFMVAGLWINILSLPGLWLLVGSVGVYAWVTGGVYVGWAGILVLVGLGIAAEIVEFVAGGAGAKKAGGSKLAFVGALVGGIAGAIFLTIPLPVIGTIIGICLGTFLGAVGVELLLKRDTGHAVRVGYGATKGRLIGIVVKLLFGILMFAIGAILGWPTGAAPASLPAPPGATSQPTTPSTMPATVPSPASAAP